RPDRPAARLARLRRPHGAPRRAARRDDGRRAARVLRARRARLPRLPHRRPSPHGGGRARGASRARRHRVPGARCRRPVALPGVLVPQGAGEQAPADDGQRQPALMAAETADVVVIGTGFGGAIPGYYLAAAGARVVMLERGPRLATEDFTHNLQLGTFTRIVDDIRGDGVDVIAGNCVGGSSVIYFAASLRAPSFVFERTGTLGRRLWPASISRRALNPWYRRVERTLPVSQQSWD